MQKAQSRSKSIVAALITLAGIVLLMKLGFWQLERLHWKQGLVAQIEAQKTVDPSTVSLVPLLDNPEDQFHRGFLRGVWMQGKNVKVGPHMREGELGYWLVTPFVLADGTAVIVNRGWVPGTMINLLLDGTPPKGIVTLHGVLRIPETGASPVGIDNRDWHKLDAEAIARASGIALPARMAVFMESSVPADEASLKPAPIIAQLRNEHLNYAIFWFGMAVLLAGIYYLAAIHPNLRGKRSASLQGPSGHVS